MRLVNLVASGDLGQKLDLDRLRDLVGRYRYDTARYHGGYILLAQCKATVYRSGKYILTGLKDPSLLTSSYDELLSLLSPFIDVTKATPPTIRNTVFLDDLGQSIDLVKVCEGIRDRVEYEPEQFPGLIYSLPRGKILVFSTGKIIITGVTSFEEAQIALSRLNSDLHAIL